MKKIISLIVAGGLLAACSDTWDNHYGTANSTGGTQTLFQVMKQTPELSDFCRVLEHTHLYNNMHSTPVTYAELLDGDQALTVWAPVNGSFNADSLLEVCKTQKGDSTVGTHFSGNHIAHNVYNLNAQTADSIQMLNGKFLKIGPKGLHHSVLENDKRNEPATNGLLHILSSEVPYKYNIYEGLTSVPDYAHIGNFFESFTRKRLDEDRSIVSGIVDGQKVYSDSVMYIENILFNRLDQINSEDSNFVMLMPTKQVWEEVEAEARPYFNYSGILGGDSISNYWTNVSLITDLLYNVNRQRSMNDSVFTVGFYTHTWPYHVYYKPFETGGYLDPANMGDAMECSNGSIRTIYNWPFTKEQIYFKPISSEAEYGSNQYDYSKSDIGSFAAKEALGDSVSNHAFLDIVPKQSASSNWNATFKVFNNLSGTYDICAVILPKTVTNQFSRDFKPNKFTGEVQYLDVDGEWKTVEFKDELTNDPYHVDTVKIGRVTVPVCSYAQLNETLRVKLTCKISKMENAKYSREMYLDCIYLRPVDTTEDADDADDDNDND